MWGFGFSKYVVQASAEDFSVDHSNRTLAGITSCFADAAPVEGIRGNLY